MTTPYIGPLLKAYKQYLHCVVCGLSAGSFGFHFGALGLGQPTGMS